MEQTVFNVSLPMLFSYIKKKRKDSRKTKRVEQFKLLQQAKWLISVADSASTHLTEMAPRSQETASRQDFVSSYGKYSRNTFFEHFE